MPRRRLVNLDHILTAAEELLSETGGVYFTLDQVAQRAGASKGSVTHAFRSKTELVNALLTREFDRFRNERQRLQRDGVTFPLVDAHLQASQQVQKTHELRASHLIAALVHEQSHLETIKALYAPVLAEAGGDSARARKARLAIFAIEGAFLMRGLGMVELPEAEWQQLFADALALL